MTLIIIGQNFEKFWGNTSDMSNGLFAVSDGNITNDNSILVQGFEKIRQIPYIR